MIPIWRDDAMRWLPLWLTITMLNTSVLLGLVFWRQASQAQNLEPSPASLLLILWLAIAFYILFGGVRTRCHRIEMTLPIAATTLWRRHLAAVFLAGSVLLAGSLGVLALHAAVIFKAGREQVLEIPYLFLVGPLMTGLLLTAALVSSVEPVLWKLGGRRGYWALVGGALVGIPLLLLGLGSWPWASSGICLILAIIVVHRAQKSLPASYRLVPATAEKAGAEESVAASTDPRAGRWQVYRALFNILHTAPPWKQLTPWMVYGFVALMGFVLAGGINRWKEAADLRFLYLPFGSYMLFAAIGILSYNLYRLDSMPVSRRTLLVVLTLPGLIFYCAGYSAGWWAKSADSYPWQLVNFNIQPARVEINLPEREGAKTTEFRQRAWVEVDSSFMGMSLTGEPPRLTSPWGESHEAWHKELFRGAAPILYNPYNTSEETSPEFEALMLSRAIEEVYGRTLSRKELQERYFVVENGELVTLRAFKEAGNIYTPGYKEKWPVQGFPLLADYPDLVPPAKGPETPVYMVLVLVPWLLLTAFFLRSFKATHSNRYIRGIYWAGLAIPMLALLGQVILAAFAVFSPEVGRSFLAITIRSLGTTPQAFAAAWAICLGAIGAAYWLALRQFEKAEIPTSPINCSLVDWGKVD